MAGSKYKISDQYRQIAFQYAIARSQFTFQKLEPPGFK